MYDNLLPDNIMMKLDKIQEADIVIGLDKITSPVSQVIDAISLGLAKYFPELKSVIIKRKDDDDKKEEIFLNKDPYENRELNFIYNPFIPIHRILMEKENSRNRTDFIQSVYKIGDILDCDACIILSGNLDTIGPEWIELLLTPIIKGSYDYNLPEYVSSKYDFIITKTLVYPLFKSLFNIKLSCPGGEDFAVSIDLARIFLEKNIWDSKMNIDVSMLITAAGEGFEMSQSFLGGKIQEKEYDLNEIGNKFVSILKAFLDLMFIYKESWSYYSKIKEIKTFGFHNSSYPDSLELNITALLPESKKEYEKHYEIIKEILEENVLRELQDALIGVNNKCPVITDELWVKIITDYINYFTGEIREYSFIKSIIPLYLFRYMYFIEEISQGADVSEKISDLCKKFETIKEVLSKKEIDPDL